MSPQTPRGGKFEPEERRCNLMNEIKNLLARLSDQRGQTMAEYAVVLAVITVVIIASLQALSGGIGSALDAVTGILP
jgi:Flp pilus assembly pilin Flp